MNKLNLTAGRSLEQKLTRDHLRLQTCGLSASLQDGMPRSCHMWLSLCAPSFLPALTLAACRIKINVTNAVSVESHSHLFVFHLVLHLCISMVSARSDYTKRATFNKTRSLPQSTKKREKRVCAYTTAPCVKVERCQSQPDRALRIRSPLSPALRLMVKGCHEKKEKEKRTALRSRGVAHRQEAGQTPQ